MHMTISLSLIYIHNYGHNLCTLNNNFNNNCYLMQHIIINEYISLCGNRDYVTQVTLSSSVTLAKFGI